MSYLIIFISWIFFTLIAAFTAAYLFHGLALGVQLSMLLGAVGGFAGVIIGFLICDKLEIY
tara:strand:+ start:904 stop:1086 length:183 start_codon:yes stop_codon:yes gene_type:complete